RWPKDGDGGAAADRPDHGRCPDDLTVERGIGDAQQVRMRDRVVSDRIAGRGQLVPECRVEGHRLREWEEGRWDVRDLQDVEGQTQLGRVVAVVEGERYHRLAATAIENDAGHPSRGGSGSRHGCYSQGEEERSSHPSQNAGSPPLSTSPDDRVSGWAA